MQPSFKTIALAFVVAGFAPSAHAASQIKLDKAGLQLLDGGAFADQKRLAGVEIVLNAGVKTYWRMPGDSGLPPVFDFSASENVASVDIQWPAPSRIKEADGTILGFENRVIFPLIITPKDPANPVFLAITLDFGLCDTLCLPAKADLARELAGTPDGASRSAIEGFLARVPKTATVKGGVQPSVLTITPEADALVLDIASETVLNDLILEASGSWYFGQAAIQAAGAGRYRAHVPIEQKPKTASLSGLGLIVTLLAEGGATETRLALDQSGSVR